VPGDNGRQGLGFDVIDLHGMRLVGHHGGVPGYEAENEMIPAERTAWVVLSDAFDFGTYRANRVVLSALFPQLASAAASATPPPEDAAVTLRFREALTSLLAGKIDRSQYSDTVKAALTPELLAATAAQLQPLGEIAKIEYVNSVALPKGTLYSYKVTFSSGKTLTWQFRIDDQGKIAGIGSTG
jgi:hypothetical protein